MRKFRYFHDEIYGTNVYFTKCTRRVYEKMVADEFGEISPEKSKSVMATFEVYQLKNKPCHVVWLSEGAGIDQLVHECLHLTHDVMQYRGLILTDQSDEAYAYFLQFIFREMKILVK